MPELRLRTRQERGSFRAPLLVELEARAVENLVSKQSWMQSIWMEQIIV